MKRIKVAHTANDDRALYWLLLNQLQAIQQAGYEVVGISSPGPNVATLEQAGIRHIAVNITRKLMTPWTDLKTLVRLVQIFRRERFTIVHTHNPKPGVLTAVAARLAGVPIIVKTLHGFYFSDHTPWILRRFYLLLETFTARFTAVVLSQNRPDIAIAIKEGVVRAGQMKYLGNGIDLTVFNPDSVTPESKAAKKKELGIPEGVPIVGFVGRLVRDKGLIELFTAARSVREHVPQVRFLFIGPVDVNKSDALSPESARDFGIENFCHFVGLRRDMPEMLSLMDVFVLPSYREGFPRACMEASAMGIPVVATDIRGCTEAVEHGLNGLLVPPRDATALGKALVQLLSDPAAAQGARGARLAGERFDERIVAAKVLEEYSRLLAEKGMGLPNVAASGVI